jgi:hypothetical protein
MLSDHLALLVKHFGVQRVQAALAKVSKEQAREGVRATEPVGSRDNRDQRPLRLTVSSALESIRDSAPEKYSILTEFLGRLVNRQVLPESQDIRHFSQVIGLKEISGKSRKEMVPKLMWFLLEQSVERLKSDLQRADDISEQQRRMGFSVLTDKLIDQ